MKLFNKEKQNQVKKRDVLRGLSEVSKVHSCASCMAHLEAIKAHRDQDHKNDN